MVELAQPVDLGTIISLADFEPPARERIDGPAFDYIAGGSWDEVTLAENEAAWRRFRFLPRVLRDVQAVDARGRFLGRMARIPVAVAPMAAQGLAHPGAEPEACVGAAAGGIPYCLSTTASRTLEEVAAAAPDAERWFQLYTVRSMDYTRTLVERAEAAGYRALVITVDLPVLGRRERDLRSGYTMPELPHIGQADLLGPSPYGALELQRGAGLTWRSIDEIRSWTSMSIVIKGILSADDARIAAEAGVAAIIVSNHGARQLDRSVTSPDVLPAIVAAVGGRCEVWADGGIRRGLDVLVALALGATGVMVGRPFFWALAVAGRAGVQHAIDLLEADLMLALPLLGCPTIAEVGPELLAPSLRG